MYLEYLKLKTSIYNYQDYINAQYHKNTTEPLLLLIVDAILESFDNEDIVIQNLFLTFIEKETNSLISPIIEEYSEDNDKGCIEFYRRK
jgi:hypothetical protein